MARNTTGVVPLDIVASLPFITAVEVSVGNQSTILDKVLVDTGSAGTILSADIMLDIGVKPSVEDSLVVIAGVGGTEYAFSKIIDNITVGPFVVSDFKIQVGAMEYGFELDGIIGMNFLLTTKAKIDFKRLLVTN